jgi:hypothetical protein
VDWQPIKTAPSNTRVLVADERGNVFIARVATLRWYDDADRLIDPPVRWMALPPAGDRDRPQAELKGGNRSLSKGGIGNVPAVATLGAL